MNEPIKYNEIVCRDVKATIAGEPMLVRSINFRDLSVSICVSRLICSVTVCTADGKKCGCVAQRDDDQQMDDIANLFPVEFSHTKNRLLCELDQVICEFDSAMRPPRLLARIRQAWRVLIGGR